MGPIGVFDSGYGGLTILKELLVQLPQYDYIYLGDNARAPYGNRSFGVIYQYTRQAVEFLFSRGAHLVLLACNTASAKALRTIQRYDIPRIGPHKRVLGVIRPSVEELASFTTTKQIGILGTSGTVQSGSYLLEIKKLFPDFDVTQHACPMWVPLVENDEYQNTGADYFIQKDLNTLLSKNSNIDAVLLACTHYPLLEAHIRQNLPKKIKVISQGTIVAQSLKNYFLRHPEIDINCRKTGQRQYFSTEDAHLFEERGKKFLGQEFSAEKVCISK